jgi:hypothetical protein
MPNTKESRRIPRRTPIQFFQHTERAKLFADLPCESANVSEGQEVEAKSIFGDAQQRD